MTLATYDENWHLVHTTREDTLARAALSQLLGADAVYRPLMRVPRLLGRRQLSHAQRRQADASGRGFYGDRFVDLFPRYRFVRFPAETPFDVLSYVEGIACEGGRPWRVPAGMIEGLRSKEVAYPHGDETLLAVPGDLLLGDVRDAVLRASAGYFQPGEVVRCVDGAFAGFDCTLESVAESGRIRALFLLFGRETVVELEARQIAKSTG